MSTPGPYEPCPCASGKKFKFCCKGRPASEQVGADDEEKPTSGTTRELMLYVQPLLDKAGSDSVSVKKSRDLGRVCWNLAMLDLAPAQEEAEVLKLCTKFGIRNVDDQRDVISVVHAMVNRHRDIFPEKHGRRRRIRGLTAEGKLFDLEDKL